MKTEIRDLGIGVVLLIFSIAGFMYSNNFKGSSDQTFGPDFFPKLVLSLLAIMAIVLIISSILNLKESQNILQLDKKIVGKIILFIVVLVIYIALFFNVGFIISSILFLLIGQWIFGVRKKILLFAISVSVPLFLYFFFTVLFKIPLP